MTEQIDYDPNTVLEALNNKADRDLNNVTDGTYQVLTTKNITNCITKIPQDIKLELNAGTLTLKAGSKVYNMSKNSYSTANSDIIFNAFGTNTGTCVLFVNVDATASQGFINANNTYSGSSLPSGSYTHNSVFFNTTDKKFYIYQNDWSEWGVSIVGMATLSNGTVTSIDQVFNCFGYIGSTVFALPGVEGLIPNGRNADGSLNNTKFKTTSVLTNTSTIGNITRKIGISSSGTLTRDIDYILDDENYLHVNTADGAIAKVFEIGSVIYDSTSRITSFNPKTTFQAIDRNEINNIIDTRINYRFQVVSELPPVQDPNTFYFIPEE